MGESTTDAEAEGRDILARNLMQPDRDGRVGRPLAEYGPGHSGDPPYLSCGILISGGEVRVAIKSDVSTHSGGSIGLSSAVVGGQALVKTKGDLLPIAVRHYINAPGPFAGAVAPLRREHQPVPGPRRDGDTSCLGSTTDASLRSTPEPGVRVQRPPPDDDPVNHGPIIALVGQGASPSNARAFRGFVALDIRNFQYQSPPSNVFYNGVTAGTNANTLKAMEAGWVATGYPSRTSRRCHPPDSNDQVGIIDGNSSGVVVDAINARYDPGRRDPRGRLLRHGLEHPGLQRTRVRARPRSTRTRTAAGRSR